MSEKTIGGLLCLIVGVAGVFWGINFNNSPGVQLMMQFGRTDYTGVIAIVGGIAVGLVGIALLRQQAVAYSSPYSKPAQTAESSVHRMPAPPSPQINIVDATLKLAEAYPEIYGAFPNDVAAQEVVAHLLGGNKIRAIQALRGYQNLSLAEAKARIDAVVTALRV